MTPTCNRKSSSRPTSPPPPSMPVSARSSCRAPMPAPTGSWSPSTTTSRAPRPGRTASSPSDPRLQPRPRLFVGLVLRPLLAQDRSPTIRKTSSPVGPLDLYVDAVQVFDTDPSGAVLSGPLAHDCPAPGTDDTPTGDDRMAGLHRLARAGRSLRRAEVRRRLDRTERHARLHPRPHPLGPCRAGDAEGSHRHQPARAALRVLGELRATQAARHLSTS